ncbi:hypothetical protein TL16_g01676 [Triparma laevis f. inornata]|uniref:Uncharacterized protein n=2 Tax=Triparma laevis TaxID=1534972 RepID=A0A9W7KW17_9STRA|nr:hypothetical protein TL16_g01676 [Triparma laevis f. inornata]GMI13385.1 hypothetical protein TrLO_g7966 [Triparma laevis f. longispina]
MPTSFTAFEFDDDQPFEARDLSTFKQERAAARKVALTKLRRSKSLKRANSLTQRKLNAERRRKMTPEEAARDEEEREKEADADAQSMEQSMDRSMQSLQSQTPTVAFSECTPSSLEAHSHQLGSMKHPFKTPFKTTTSNKKRKKKKGKTVPPQSQNNITTKIPTTTTASSPNTFSEPNSPPATPTPTTSNQIPTSPITPQPTSPQMKNPPITPSSSFRPSSRLTHSRENLRINIDTNQNLNHPSISPPPAIPPPMSAPAPPTTNAIAKAYDINPTNPFANITIKIPDDHPTLKPTSTTLASLFTPVDSVSKEGSFLRAKFSTVEKMRDAQKEVTRKKELTKTLHSFAQTNENPKPRSMAPSTQNIMKEMNVTKAIMIREQYLLNLQDLATFIDDKYKKYQQSKKAHRKMHKKLKSLKATQSTTALEISEMNKLIVDHDSSMKKIGRVITQSHAHLAVTVAQLRACTIEVLEAVASWQDELVSSQMQVTASLTHSQSIIPPPFMYQSNNYVVKMTSDLVFMNETNEIFGEWLGFDPKQNPLFVPSINLDVKTTINSRRERMTVHIRIKRETAAKARAAKIRMSMSKNMKGAFAAMTMAGEGSARRLRRSTEKKEKAERRSQEDKERRLPKFRASAQDWSKSPDGSPGSPKPFRKTMGNGNDLAGIRDSVMKSVSNEFDQANEPDLDSDEELELNFPDMFPEVQLVQKLPEGVQARCEEGQEVIAREMRHVVMREQRRADMLAFRSSAYRPGTTTGAGSRPGTCGAEEHRSLMERITRPSTALDLRKPQIREEVGGHSATTKAFISTFFVTQGEETFNLGGTAVDSKRTTTGANSYSSRLLTPIKVRPSTSLGLSTVFPVNPAKHVESPFPLPLQGKMLVNFEAKGKNQAFKYDTKGATVVLQAFGRFILARARISDLKAYRKTSQSASMIQRVWRGKKGRTDFFVKLRSKKTADIRRRIEERDIKRAAVILQRFFDNVRYTKMEELRKSAAERRRVQHKIWARRAMMDAAAFQIQRVWNSYMAKKIEWEIDYEIKYKASTRIQGGVRIRLARKRVAERKKRTKRAMTMKIKKKEAHAEVYTSIIMLQCWARIMFANERAQRKREKRSGKLAQKLAGFGGVMVGDGDSSVDFGDFGSVGSISTASITMLMGATAAEQAAKLACDLVEQETYEDDYARARRDSAILQKARPNSRKGSKTRRNIVMGR